MFKAIDIGPYAEDGELAVKLMPVGDEEKLASVLGKHIPEEIAAFAKIAKSSDDCVWLHIIAMTASDYYGPNRNGDFFYEADLLGMQGADEAAKNLDKWKDVPVLRYKTFEQASYYHHHKNKPDLGHPRFGRVVVVAYNHIMHRVELVVQVFRIEKKINGITYLGDSATCNDAMNGKPIAFSMGCKVPGDYCSITGVWNKTVDLYGPHLKYSMGKILPDGRRVYAINKKPRFFDISKVMIPADPNGLSITKVAEFGLISSAQKAIDYGMEAFEKLSMDKKSEIKKTIPDGKLIGELSDEHEMPGLEYTDEDLPPNVMNMLGNLPLGKALTNLLASGMLASPREVGTIITIRIERSPNWMKEAPDIDWNGGVDTDIQKELAKHAAARSFFGTHPLNRMEKLAGIEEKAEKSLPEKIYAKFNKQLPAGVTLGALLASIYAIYRKNIRGGSLEDFFKLIEKNPYVLPALVGGGVLASSTLSASMNKEASLHKSVNKMLLATAIPYLGSAYLTQREHEGKQLNSLQRLIKEHPGTLAVGANIGAFGGAKHLKDKLTSKVAHLKKCAALDKMDVIDNFVVQPMTSLSGSIPHAMAGGSIDSYVLNKLLSRKRKTNPSSTEK